MATRTTSMDRRMAIHVIQAIPEVPEEVIKTHLKQAELSHNLIKELLQADPARVDKEAFRRAIRGKVQTQSTKIRQFTPGVLGRVRALGGQFAQARMTEVPGGETLESQRWDEVIKFWTDWHFNPEEAERLTVASSIGSEVIYLTDLVEGSLCCTYDKVDSDRKSVEEILASLPQVEGLRWIVGNMSTVNRVLANRLKETGEYLLPGVYTWTTDKYKRSKYGGLLGLLVGYFGSHGVLVNYLRPGYWLGDVGVFVLGVPE